MSFAWKFSQIPGSEVFVNLIKRLESSRITLKKLRITHPRMKLDESQKASVLDFLKGLESVEVLYLSGFHRTEDKFCADIIDSVFELMLLRFGG